MHMATQATVVMFNSDVDTTIVMYLGSWYLLLSQARGARTQLRLISPAILVPINQLSFWLMSVCDHYAIPYQYICMYVFSYMLQGIKVSRYLIFGAASTEVTEQDTRRHPR